MSTSREARTAAKWWADAVQSPRFDNGDKSSVGDMTQILALLASKPPSSTDAGTFETLLAERIDAEMSGRNPEYGVTLDVDYHPDFLLAGVAAQAGVSLTNFPWKTVMWVKPGSVRVKAGYGAAHIDLPLVDDAEAVA